jgi:hypothetical protein
MSKSNQREVIDSVSVGENHPAFIQMNELGMKVAQGILQSFTENSKLCTEILNKLGMAKTSDNFESFVVSASYGALAHFIAVIMSCSNQEAHRIMRITAEGYEDVFSAKTAGPQTKELFEKLKKKES